MRLLGAQGLQDPRFPAVTPPGPADELTRLLHLGRPPIRLPGLAGDLGRLQLAPPSHWAFGQRVIGDLSRRHRPRRPGGLTIP